MKEQTKVFFGRETIEILEEIIEKTKDFRDEYKPCLVTQLYHADNDHGERLTISVGKN